MLGSLKPLGSQQGRGGSRVRTGVGFRLKEALGVRVRRLEVLGFRVRRGGRFMVRVTVRIKVED